MLHVYKACQEEAEHSRTVSTKNARKRAADYLGVAQSTLGRLVQAKKLKPGPKPVAEEEKGATLYLDRSIKILAYNLVEMKLKMHSETGEKTSSPQIWDYLFNTMHLDYFKNARQTRRFLVSMGFEYEKGDDYTRLKTSEHIKLQLRAYLHRFVQNK
jgi:hypothetical protein